MPHIQANVLISGLTTNYLHKPFETLAMNAWRDDYEDQTTKGKANYVI